MSKTLMETIENEKLGANILIEAKLLEQEHRPTHLVLNYINRKKNYPDEDDPRRKAVQRAIIWRLFFSPAMLAIGGSATLGIITLFILMKQNNIIEQQTGILQEQNSKIEIQARLEDANRRNNLVFLMDNVLNRIDDELKDPKNKDSSLSKPLLARIRALGHGFQPYKFIDYSLIDSLNRDSLVLTKLWSPERGQLLLSLANSAIGKETMFSIYYYTGFDNAYLKSANLMNANLAHVGLKNANLMNAHLVDVNLLGADLRGADLRGAKLAKADLTWGEFKRADMRGADLSKTYLIQAYLNNTDLREVLLNGAILKGADLRGANLKDANLENIKTIESCRVDRQDWLIYIRDSLKLKGAAILVEKYKIEEYKYGDYIIIKK